MNVSNEEIHDLEKWLESRLGALVSHGEKVRELLRVADGPREIIKSATAVVLGDSRGDPALTPQQLAVWQALLPIVAEHGLLAARGGGLVLEEDKALNKIEAAEYLGVSVRKLQRHMNKRQIEYEKYGTGKTACVRFRRAELDRFRQSREVPARTIRETE
jgi:excisionase family DNA binding protein